MRDQMPEVAAFIDDLRSAFGEAQINGAIRSGLKGGPHFWAAENGHELGTWWERCGPREAAEDGAAPEAPAVSVNDQPRDRRGS